MDTIGSCRVAGHSLLLDGCPQPLCLQRTAQFSSWWSSHGVAYASSLIYGFLGTYFSILRKSVWLGKSSSSSAGCLSHGELSTAAPPLLPSLFPVLADWLDQPALGKWGGSKGREGNLHGDRWCSPQLQAWRRHFEGGERCCTFLRLLGATCFSRHRLSSCWGLFPLWSLPTGCR